MQSIAQISFTVIVCYQRVGDELEVNPIAMSLHYIIVNRDVLAFPQMNSVADLIFVGAFSC